MFSGDAPPSFQRFPSLRSLFVDGPSPFAHVSDDMAGTGLHCPESFLHQVRSVQLAPPPDEGAYNITSGDDTTKTPEPVDQQPPTVASEPPSKGQEGTGLSAETTSDTATVAHQPTSVSQKKQRGQRDRPPKVRNETKGVGATEKAIQLPDLADLPDLDALIAEVRAERSME